MTRRPRGRRLSVVLPAVLLAALSLSSLPGSAQASAETDAESLIISLVNHERSARGLVPLRQINDLVVIAGSRAGKMASANTLSHSVGGDIGRQLDGRGLDWYRYGEAIAYTTSAWADSAARTLFKMWMGSDAHRALLLSTKFNYVGVGLAHRSSDNRTFGTVLMSESPDMNGARSLFTGSKVSGDDITWSWTGADVPLQTHTAGLRDYDVQYRVGSGSWQTTRNDTTSKTITLHSLSSGVGYGVRVRATDRHGNAGAWTAERRVTLP
jgi:uncharacterized protein YkwD